MKWIVIALLSVAAGLIGLVTLHEPVRSPGVPLASAPVNDDLTVHFENAEKYDYQLRTGNGALIEPTSLTSESRVTLTGLTRGSYVIEFSKREHIPQSLPFALTDRPVTLRVPKLRPAPQLWIDKSFGTLSLPNGRFIPAPTPRALSIPTGATTYARIQVRNDGPEPVDAVSLSDRLDAPPNPAFSTRLERMSPHVPAELNDHGGFDATFPLQPGETVEFIHLVRDSEPGERCGDARVTAPGFAKSVRACLTSRQFRPDGHLYVSESRDADVTTGIRRNRNYSVIGGFEANLNETYETVVYVENHWNPWRSNDDGTNVPVFGQLPLNQQGRYDGNGFEVESVRYALIDKRTEPHETVAAGTVPVRRDGRFGLHHDLPREHVITLTVRIKYTRPGRYCTYGPFLAGHGYPNTHHYPRQHCVTAR